MDPEVMKQAIEKMEIFQYEYDGMVMSNVFPAKTLDKIKETEFHDEDIMVATYPKCGTTWMQEIVFMVQNDGDAKEEENIPLIARWQFIEMEIPGLISDYDTWASLPPPRLVKSHLSSDFFQKTLKNTKTKFINVFRNPKDTLVSYYHFYKMNAVFDFSGTWNEFFELFKEKKLVHGDYFEVQLSWWKLRDDPRILIVKYEDMLKAPEVAIRQVMKHLGKSLSDEVVNKIAQKTSFKAMKDNPLVNYTNIPVMRSEISPFMRKGKVGDWKNYFSKEQAAYVDKLSSDLFEPVGLYMEDE